MGERGRAVVEQNRGALARTVVRPRGPPRVRALLGLPLLAASRLRRTAYEHGWLRRERLAGPVVSVGNLAVGGRGKTPVVARVCEILREEGREVAVLSRGYRGSFRGDCLVVSDGVQILASAAEAGDEPVMLARQLPGVVVAVGPRRARVGQAVEARFGRRVHVLDDGFQHLALHRDLDIVCVEACDLGDVPMPGGRLRESPSALRRADLILLAVPTRGGGAPLEPAPARGVRPAPEPAEDRPLHPGRPARPHAALALPARRHRRAGALPRRGGLSRGGGHGLLPRPPRLRHPAAPEGGPPGPRGGGGCHRDHGQGRGPPSCRSGPRPAPPGPADRGRHRERGAFCASACAPSGAAARDAREALRPRSTGGRDR